MATSTCILPCPECEEPALVVEQDHATNQCRKHCIECGYYEDDQIALVKPPVLKRLNKNVPAVLSLANAC